MRASACARACQTEHGTINVRWMEERRGGMGNFFGDIVAGGEAR